MTAKTARPVFCVDAGFAVANVGDGASVMFGGFGGAGFPARIRDGLAAKGVRDLTVIGNNADFGALLLRGSIKALVCSYPTGESAAPVVAGIEAGRIELVLTPQGTLVEQLHAGGAGLGGFLTRTGLGTEIADRWEVLDRFGQEHLLVPALTADFAFLKASRADSHGNLFFKKASKNFNPLMALAARCVVAEVEELVVGESLAPDEVHVPGAVVDVVLTRAEKVGSDAAD